ncbi:MAG: Bax inhibitor-1/YccA family protein [Bifidobacteriaceae bacterium]|jgi:uncharacterized YccA/Bax inhibitor family protein|nr:Bax inhibitor-1/YccA family protein [Bifidobacteriaceae bacterium]
MSNPVFRRSDDFKPRNYPPGAGTQVYGDPQYGAGYTGYQGAPTAAGLNAMYAAPAAGPVQTGRLTYDDVLIKTAGMFGVLLVGATFGWMSVRAGHPEVIWGSCLIAFILAMVNSFKRNPSPVLITLYAVFEGLCVGGLSMVFEALWPGIVMQAVIGTLAVFGVTLVLFKSGKVRASAKATKIWFVAMLGYAVFSLVNMVLMWTGVVNDPFGLRSVKVMGIPIGVVIGLVVIVMAAYAYVMDFDFIKTAVVYGAPAKVAWTAAFGLLVTTVWLYLEVLRLLAIIRDS